MPVRHALAPGRQVRLHPDPAPRAVARQPEPGKKRIFFANPWAIAFTSRSGPGTGYVVASGSDLLVKVIVAGDGKLSFTVDSDTTRYIDLNDPANPATSGANAGKNPQGIAINPAGTRAYVMNVVSRNVSVVDLVNDTVIKTIATSALPAEQAPAHPQEHRRDRRLVPVRIRRRTAGSSAPVLSRSPACSGSIGCRPWSEGTTSCRRGPPVLS